MLYWLGERGDEKNLVVVVVVVVVVSSVTVGKSVDEEDDR